jgi:predicted PurR-regulated permease PerM
MKAVKGKSEESPAHGQASGASEINAGEFRPIVIGAAALAVALYWIKLILLPFVLAAIVAYIFTPLLDWAAKRTRWPRLLFAIARFIVLCALVLGLGLLAGQRLLAEARATGADLQSLIEKFTGELFDSHPINLFGTTLDAHRIAQSLIERMRDWLGQSDMLAFLFGYSAAGAMGAFLTIVLLFYFLVSGERVAQGLFWIVPPHRRPLVARIWKRLDPVLMRYFIGVFVVVVYAAIAAYIGLGVILGIQHAVLLALLTGILEVFPVVGPTAAAVIAGLVSLRTASGVANILEYALYATLLRLSIDQLVGPVVLGRAVHAHPVLIIFCFLAGGVVLGIPGVILAVPIALMVKSTLATLYDDQ